MKVCVFTKLDHSPSLDAHSLNIDGYRLIQFASPDQSMGLVKEQLPHLVLLDDVILPSEQLATITMLRQDPITSRLPILVITSSDASAAIDVSDASSIGIVSETLTTESLRRLSEWFLAKTGYLTLVISKADPKASLLTKDAKCEWTRTGLGIVGLVDIPFLPADRVESTLQECCQHAYARLDELPEDKLSFEDLWNLLLFLSVPYSGATDSTSVETDVRGAIIQYAQDTVGSRKLPLWQAQSPLAHISVLRPGEHSWAPVSGDPLRDALDSSVTDDIERQALDVLFRRRITDEDFDRVIRVLGRNLFP